MKTIYTLGHSNHTLDVFLGIISEHGIRQLADVRRYPSSRRWPQFNSRVLADSLATRDVAYRHCEDLGGMRPTTPEAARHTALEFPWQRDYAAYMNTPAYNRALQDLITWGLDRPTAIMCAEASPRQCHRLLLSDALMQAGVRVIHVSPGSTQSHSYPSSLRIDKQRLIYDQGVLPFT